LLLVGGLTRWAFALRTRLRLLAGRLGIAWLLVAGLLAAGLLATRLVAAGALLRAGTGFAA
jgi:hypothetical protein